jgi:hypothetical protein
MKNEESRSRVGVPSVLVVLFVLFLSSGASALELERLRVQRQEVFEFTDKPKVTREGDKTTLAFATKDYGDATVAIEDDIGNQCIRSVRLGYHAEERVALKDTK